MAAQVGTTALDGYLVGQHIAAAVTATQAETANGILAKVSVPAGAVIYDVVLTVTDMDSATAGLVDVGDTDDDDRFIANFSIQAAGTIRLSDTDDSPAYKYAADADIEVTISTPAGTGVAGTVTLTVLYFKS